MSTEPLLRSDVPGFPCRRGKVRDVYDLGETLVIVATDRISAFDWVMPTGIPDKGRILTAMSVFWFDWLKVPASPARHRSGAASSGIPARELVGRTMHVRKTEVLPIECVARGYLAGSGWKEYKASRTICGIPLLAGLREADRLPEPIFTPATKEEGGKHDENIGFERMAGIDRCGHRGGTSRPHARRLSRAAGYAEKHGIILADTKLEWGRLPSGELILIDEVLTPDSSRFWPKHTYRPAHRRRPSTSNSCATGWKRRAGTRKVRLRPCPRMSWKKPPRSIAKHLSD